MVIFRCDFCGLETVANMWVIDVGWALPKNWDVALVNKDAVIKSQQFKKSRSLTVIK